ncbi:hypothetical protein [Desulfosediminicola flagellatus]|uniref:hypothetical protein n=1 Tax=Desulfosediminicola flagellatus TaxID=2569541 RepID=UPI0010AB7ED1|nr:hypothetical protein [Desulfosediminicola flagellatus]
MPIEFKSHKSENYFLSKWSGKIYDSDMIEGYKSFFESDDWVPGMWELADLSEVDFTSISPEGLINFNQFTKSWYKANNIRKTQTAAYCPDDLQYGIVKTYETLSKDSPEIVRVFRDLNEAKNWISRGSSFPTDDYVE